MIRLEEVMTVPRTVQDCYRYLQDFSTAEQWDPGVYRAVKQTPGPVMVGTQFDLLLNSAGRRLPMQYRITRLSPPREIVMQGEAEGLRALDTISLDDAGHGRTRIRYRADFTFTGRVARIEPLLHPWLRRVGRQAVAGLARALTPETQLPGPGLRDRLAHRTLLPAAWSFTERGYLRMTNKGLSHRVDGKTFVITGPTSGLGLATACELARLGARLLLVGRDTARLADAVAHIRDFSGCATTQLEIFEAELSLLSEVERIAPVLQAAAPQLDGLINNAGALFAEHGLTREGQERALAINLLAPWRLMSLLLPQLEAAGGRVINVASGGLYAQALHPQDMQYLDEPYDGSKAYARAKRALVDLTAIAAARVPGVTFHSMHPGWAATPGVAKSLPAFNARLQRWLRDARMGADTIVWLASAPVAAQGSGQFWFDRLPRPTALLPGTDVTPAQRGQLLAFLASLVPSDALLQRLDRPVGTLAQER
ncbi:SDR family NAD(P)-dependent oxidoreductase [Isoalcanivorax indicus]|uniref:SDR family NAD(P)-dependent oxidoreductase n=1 Tax=Isoalcanivorax indicus TaxID=2202653 RepID=UPI000DB9A369|nr:SDR family NAD(P)-dependent oxidoreductase [Isoalcanivorax indicus]